MESLRSLLYDLNPGFRRYLADPDRADLPDLINAAERLRGDIGLPRVVWAEACVTHGRTTTAAAVVLAGAKDPATFTHGPVAWLRGVLGRAPAEIDLWASVRAEAKRRAGHP